MASDEFESPPGLPPLSPIELLRVVTLNEAARLSSLCVDTLTEVYADKIIDLSPKRKGMRQGDALMLGKKK